MNTIILVKKLVEKLKEEGRSKRWFINNYATQNYNTVNMQLLGYSKLQQSTIDSIERYLSE